MRLSTVAIACATLCAAWSASAAHADIVHFVNPAPGQPGHFAWGQITEEDWLDITVGPSQQSNQPSGRSISQSFQALGSNANVHEGEGRGAFIMASPDIITFTSPLLVGEPVTPSGLEREWSTVGVHAQFNPFTWEFYSWFPQGEARYIGVLTTGGNIGWIEVTRIDMFLVAHAWAYETVPGAPIAAGQVPSPGAAVLLGLGTVTLRRRRS